jgi:glucose 1-dehydrogenase
MYPTLADKNVLVTGGTSGIGQAIAVRFAAEGARVAINYREDPEKADETVSLVHQVLKENRGEDAVPGENYILVEGDVTVEEDVAGMVNEVVETLGGLDILVNNAGIQIERASAELSLAEFDAVLNVNLRGAFTAAREAVRHFLAEEKQGVILNISSVHEIIPRPRYLSYAISKSGMANLTRTLALEYAGRGIRVNALGPGATVTPINRAWVEDPEKAAEVAEHIPMDRPAEPAEIAAAAAFLASEQAAYITGQTLYIDGGLTLYPDFQTPWSGG